MPNTAIAASVREFLGEAEAGRARQLTRACVRCGMCSAVCPTYALTGDELDSPRGRIHLVRDLLQNDAASASAVRHLDRCLGCRACESACPSGVQYGQLADIGRHLIRQKNPRARPLSARIARAAVAGFCARPALVKTAATVARIAAPVLPDGLRKTLAPQIPKSPAGKFSRKIIALPGCVESQFAPGGFAALKKIANAAEVDVVAPKEARCCGALRLHLGDRQRALADISQTDRAWRGAIADGAEAVVSPSSGCEAVIREHAALLPPNQAPPPPVWNPAEFVDAEWEKISAKLRPAALKIRVAFHAPCTLRNVVRMEGRVESILSRAGFELTPVGDPHMCCGSAGTYSLLQPAMARELRKRKAEKLRAANPDRIATANAGCQMFLSSKIPVVHWLQLLAERLR